MHGLLKQLLSERDLAKAGDLFSLSHQQVEESSEEALALIEGITANAHPDKDSQSNQNVLEICVTRITSAIRETNTMEKHAKALVSLLRACLKHDLRPSAKDVDSLYTKICSDVLSCIFQSYSNSDVMALAAPVTVCVLEKGNEELTRNASSYLSLAVIGQADLIAPHVHTIVESIAAGNHSLIRMLGQLYPYNATQLQKDLPTLMGVVEKVSDADKLLLAKLFLMVANDNPVLLATHVSTLCTYLSSESSSLALTVVDALCEIARYDSTLVSDHKEALIECANVHPTTGSHIIPIMGVIGLIKGESEECVDYLVYQLSHTDLSHLPNLLTAISNICEKHAELLPPHCSTIRPFTAHSAPVVRHLAQDMIHRAERERQQSRVCSTELIKSPDQMSLISTRPNTTQTDSSSSGIVGRNRSGRSREGANQSQSPISVQTDIPYPDPVQQFCERNLDKIKRYIEGLTTVLPLPGKCTVEEKRKKNYRYLRLFFMCAGKKDRCIYLNQKFFTLKSKNPKTWIHLMFLNLQAKASKALKQEAHMVGALRSCWECLCRNYNNVTFVQLVTSSFPGAKEQQLLSEELFTAHYFDVMSLDQGLSHWSCFMCNSPEKVTSLLKEDGLPALEGHLKEKKGKWKSLKRWKKKHFTLSGDHLTFQKEGEKKETLTVGNIQSVRAVRRRRRDIPKAFEIFTDRKTYRLKANKGQDVEQWVQCIHVALAKSRKASGKATVA